VKKGLLIIAIILGFASSSFAVEARIDDVKVEYGSQLKASFIVRDAFKKGMEEAIQSGIPTSFTFIVGLHRRKRMWFDEHIGAWKFRHTVKYDILKEEYQVAIEERNLVEKTKDLEEVKRLMVTCSDVIISPLPALRNGDTYKLMIKAELDTVDLPFILNYMLFFVKLWDFETGWYVYNLTPQ